jgi:ABC-type nitrate/sulfonate/bicarbonate transport system substrate-binding protein
LLAACGSSGSKGATGAAVSTTPGQRITPLTVQLVWIKNVQFAGSFVAQARGYYTRFGVRPDLLAGGPNTSVEPIVASGKALVGISNPDTVASAVAAGAPLVIVATTYQRSPFTVMSPAGQPLRSPQALVGKKVGVPVGSSALWQTFLRANKVDPSSVNQVPVQFDPQPLVTGEVDAYMGFITDEAIILQLKGFAIHTFLFEDFGYHLYGDCYLVRSDTLQDPTKRAVVTGFLQAEHRGWQDAVDDAGFGAQQAVTLSGKALGLDLHQQTLEAQAQNALVKPAGYDRTEILRMRDADITANLATLALSGSKGATAALFSTALLADLQA